MKKNWMAAIAGTLLLAACGDNSTETTYNDKTTETAPTTITPEYNPPDNVRTSFQAKYPSASNVTWSPYKPYDRINWEWTGWPSMDTSYYAVNYTVDNKPHMSWWDKVGSWMGSSSVLEDSTMLPDPVKKTLKNNYTGYKITSIDEENDKNRTVYEIKLEKGDAHARILVDKNGKILKKDTKA
ncbi:MAG TPA: PepSY-like domain-containing protein [Chitinophagaceae bacterium]|nr:PepSY-like domain-containing protein [Chitinophagaceae bacterium]